MPSKNSFDVYNTLNVDDKTYHYYDLKSSKVAALADIDKLPLTIKVLLENVLRFEDDEWCSTSDVEALANWAVDYKAQEIAYHPARVLMQDFTGVPAVVDLAAMRDAMVKAGDDPQKINPLNAVDLVIDHSVVVDEFATSSAFARNVEIEMERNLERYEFLKWGQQSFKNFSAVPPGTGICHQVNLEFLAKCAWSGIVDGDEVLYPDTLVGTDSHTTMINGLGVLGWGVGGIEAEAAMLGQPVTMLIPEVVGFELTGKMAEGITATDLVLRVVQMLREHGVVGKFVEFYGSALDHLTLSDRATIANMAPEYGATCGFFPIDDQTLSYLELTNRDPHIINRLKAYCQAQGLWRDRSTPAPEFSSKLSLDVSTVTANLAGPKRPQDRVAMPDLGKATEAFMDLDGKASEADKAFPLEGSEAPMHHGDVVVAAITSCTNTSNPDVMVGAGLVAKKAIERGLQRKPWVKSSLAPGSKVVTDYLEAAGLSTYLDQLGFQLVGYGCTTCIGNSGPLPDAVEKTVADGDMVVCSVLSGNRNFEGRIHPRVKANWLASPPLVVAYALAGTTRINLETDPIGKDQEGNDVFLKDIWPTSAEIAEAAGNINQDMFESRYSAVFEGTEEWRAIECAEGATYQWNPKSTYIQLPPFFEDQYLSGKDQNIVGARVLAKLADSTTTDHISPAGEIPSDSPAADYLRANGVPEAEFNSYGSRRGNHEVMMRGTFGNIRIKNELVPGTEGGYTTMFDNDAVVSIYDAAMEYMERGIPTVVVAGTEYGTGSSRDWAAKGTLLLGVKAVIVESFERIHRSNLVGMGVLPLQFRSGEDRHSLELDGDVTIDILGLDGKLTPKQEFEAVIHYKDGSSKRTTFVSRLDTAVEVDYYLAGGILQYVLNRLKS